MCDESVTEIVGCAYATPTTNATASIARKIACTGVTANTRPESSLRRTRRTRFASSAIAVTRCTVRIVVGEPGTTSVLGTNKIDASSTTRALRNRLRKATTKKTTATRNAMGVCRYLV